MNDEILQQLIDLIKSHIQFDEKKFLNMDEAAEYLGLKKTYLYKMNHLRKIARFKPNGKKVYFAKEDLDAYLQQHRIKSTDELETEAVNYVMFNKKGIKN